jgi:hypothetical protein
MEVSSKEEFIRVVKRNRIRQEVGTDGNVVELSLTLLKPLFKFPLHEAAAKLEICPTALKRFHYTAPLS